MNELRQELLHYLMHESSPRHRESVCGDMVILCRGRESAPTASREQWDAELDGMIESGIVVRSGDLVSIDRAKINQGSSEESDQQPSLFQQ